MRRLLPILFLVAGLLLVAGLVSGIADPGTWHARLGFVALGATLVAHALAFENFRATARRVDRLAIEAGLPDWVGAQAEKNRRKAFAYLIPGVLLASLSGWPGGGLGHLLVSASAVSFEVGAFAGLALIGIGQARLLRDVEGWARSALPAGDP